MRIDLNVTVGQTSDAGQARKASSPALGAGSAVPAADSAQLSTDQATIYALSAAVLRLPEIRQEKVTVLAEQLQKGSYAVSAEQAGEALLTALTGNRAA